MKKTLEPQEMTLLFQTIDNYKKTDDYQNLVNTVVSLFMEKDKDLHLLVSEYLE